MGNCVSEQDKELYKDGKLTDEEKIARIRKSISGTTQSSYKSTNESSINENDEENNLKPIAKKKKSGLKKLDRDGN